MDKNRFEYEGPIQITHWVEDWGTVYVGKKELGTALAESLGIEDADYEWSDIDLYEVRISIEVIKRDAPLPPPAPLDPILDFQGPTPPEGEAE